jgi:hypothetical protein
MEIQQQKKRIVRHKWAWTIALVPLIVALALLLWIWNNTSTAGTATSTSGNIAVQTNEGGQVTIKVTWQGRSAGPVFTIEMDTHAIDLDSYDLRQLAVLRTDQGQEIQPSGWNAPAGGHHRTGTLTFPATTASGTPVIGPKTRTLELIIRNVSGVPERSFRWTL